MAFKPFAYRSTAMVLVLSIGLAACQTTGSPNSTATNTSDTSSLTPTEQQLRAEANVFNETVAGGAVMGALGGAAIGALAGALSGRKDRIITYAVAGAIGGGILGGADGYVTAKKQENANNTVRTLNAVAEDVRKENDRLARVNETSRQILAEGNTRLAQIKADVQANKLSVADAQRERSHMEQNLTVMQQTLDTSRKKRDNFQQASAQMRRDGGDTRELNRQIAQMEKEVKVLEERVNDYARALEVTRV